MEYDDLDLVRRALDGDRQAMQRILDLCEIPIQRTVLSQLNLQSREDRDDVMQDSRFALVKSLKAFRNDGDGGLIGFAKGIARNYVRRYVRKKEREKIKTFDPHDSASPMATAPSWEALPELEAIGADLCLRIEARLKARLSPRDFLCYQLLLQGRGADRRDGHQLEIPLPPTGQDGLRTPAEVARALGTSRNNVDQILSRIRVEIKKILLELGENAPGSDDS